MNIKKLSLGVLAVAAIAITSIYLARQAGVFDTAGNPQTDAPQKVAKVETSADVAAGVGREGALKKLGRLGDKIGEKVSDILDTEIIHNSPEPPELPSSTVQVKFRPFSRLCSSVYAGFRGVLAEGRVVARFDGW